MTEYCRGVELFAHVLDKVQLKDGEARWITAQLCQTVHYLHNEAHICHRDLKPENILVNRSGRVHAFGSIKVIDFGLSKLLGSPTELMKTRIGTPYYVAPEILRGGTEYSVACDMWSLGVIVFFMLHGNPPFHEESEPRLFRQIQQADYSICKEEVGEEAADFISRLLKVDPRERMTI